MASQLVASMGIFSATTSPPVAFALASTSSMLSTSTNATGCLVGEVARSARPPPLILLGACHIG